ncbi:MAG: PEPxxWA-CTERM sorting domain-containing protein [Pseudomonadota bacterium]
MKAYLTAVALAMAALPARAAVSSIDFDTAPRGAFSGSITEDGFVYSALSGVLFVNGIRPSEQNMEGRAVDGGGVLKIVAADGGDFTFLSLIFGHYGETVGVERAITVHGLLDGQVLATQTGRRLSGDRQPSIPGPGGSGGNYELFDPPELTRLIIDELRIELPAGTDPTTYYLAVDRLFLQAVAVPEPRTWALMILGFAAAGSGLRRQRRAAQGVG